MSHVSARDHRGELLMRTFVGLNCSDRQQGVLSHAPSGSVLTVRGAAPSEFRRFIELSVTELAQLDYGCITLTGQDVKISGAVRSIPAEARIKESLAELNELGFNVSFDLTVPTLSEQAVACQEEYNRRLEPGEAVLFDFDSAEIHAAGRRLLDEIIDIGRLCPELGVLVTGHSDAVGDKGYNIELSERRARAVVDYMVSKGSDPDRLTPVGFGFSQPIAENSTEEGRAKNRRIEFRVREE